MAHRVHIVQTIRGLVMFGGNGEEGLSHLQSE